MIQCCTSGVSLEDTGVTYRLRVLPSPPVMFRKVQTDMIHKEMIRRALSGSSVFKTCIEMLLKVNYLYKEENTCTE